MFPREFKAPGRRRRHPPIGGQFVDGVPGERQRRRWPYPQMAMTTRYQHLAPQLIEGIARQVAGLLRKADWDDN
ncbi:hypothetical protein [Micromonospora sp. CPCC 205558]|uniref:hypothetical protein n=1 Tax=Micromonospora sp. CPCC 205558 TaxID=3122403 RepID=UPI002FEFB458